MCHSIAYTRAQAWMMNAIAYMKAMAYIVEVTAHLCAIAISQATAYCLYGIGDCPYRGNHLHHIGYRLQPIRQWQLPIHGQSPIPYRSLPSYRQSPLSCRLPQVYRPNMTKTASCNLHTSKYSEPNSKRAKLTTTLASCRQDIIYHGWHGMPCTVMYTKFNF